MNDTTDEAHRRAQALKLATKAATQALEAEERSAAAMRWAQEHGASLRDIATATGVPHVTVSRVLRRLAEGPPDVPPRCPVCGSIGRWSEWTVDRDGVGQVRAWRALCSKEETHWTMPGRDLTADEL